MNKFLKKQLYTEYETIINTFFNECYISDEQQEFSENSMWNTSTATINDIPYTMYKSKGPIGINTIFIPQGIDFSTNFPDVLYFGYSPHGLHISTLKRINEQLESISYDCIADTSNDEPTIDGIINKKIVDDSALQLQQLFTEQQVSIPIFFIRKDAFSVFRKGPVNIVKVSRTINDTKIKKVNTPTMSEGLVEYLKESTPIPDNESTLYDISLQYLDNTPTKK